MGAAIAQLLGDCGWSWLVVAGRARSGWSVLALGLDLVVRVEAGVSVGEYRAFRAGQRLPQQGFGALLGSSARARTPSLRAGGQWEEQEWCTPQVR